jgi:hypothetical protein
MRPLLLVTTVMIAFAVIASPQTPPPMLAAPPSPKGEVLEYGLYEAIGRVIIRANPRTLTGKQRGAHEIRLIKQTDRVPATLGTVFDFRFQITGILGRDYVDLLGRDYVDLQKVVKHPPIKNVKGEIETQYSVTEREPIKDGVVSGFTGYTLDHAEELIPGVWTFELWYHDHKLISQSFTVYALLTVSENDEIKLDGKKIAVDDLADAIRHLSAIQRASLMLQADKKASSGIIVKVMDAVELAGVKRSADIHSGDQK